MAFAGSAAASIFQIPERVDDLILAPFPELLEGHAFGMSVQQRDVDPVIVNRGPGIVERKSLLSHRNWEKAVGSFQKTCHKAGV